MVDTLDIADALNMAETSLETRPRGGEKRPGAHCLRAQTFGRITIRKFLSKS